MRSIFFGNIRLIYEDGFPLVQSYVKNMNQFIFKLKQKLKKTPIFFIVVYFRRITRGYGDLIRRVEENKYEHSPTHDLIKKVQSANNIKVFVETGTFIGNTLIGLNQSFQKLYSIELDKGIYRLAKKRLSDRSNVEIFHGDSAKQLPKILNVISEPAIFWLDAHYSSGVTGLGELQTPVMRELKAIFDHPVKKHHILIDDVKDFNGLNDYPTVDEILDFISKYANGLYVGRVEGQVFVVEPRLI